MLYASSRRSINSVCALAIHLLIATVLIAIAPFIALAPRANGGDIPGLAAEAPVFLFAILNAFLRLFLSACPAKFVGKYAAPTLAFRPDDPPFAAYVIPLPPNADPLGITMWRTLVLGRFVPLLRRLVLAAVAEIYLIYVASLYAVAERRIYDQLDLALEIARNHRILFLAVLSSNEACKRNKYAEQGDINRSGESHLVPFA